jgi:hypothetical protein
MRKVTTIICSIAFMISGIMMAITASDPSPGTNYKTISAATPSQPLYIPYTIQKTDTGTLDLSEDLVRDLAKKKGLLDTVYITKTDTVKEEVTKVKWRKAPVPAPIVVRDTIREAHYYLATQVGMKDGPKDQCIPIYEVHKVDELCPEIINSSGELMNESDNDVGE